MSGVLPVAGTPPVPFEGGVLPALFGETILPVSARSPPQPAARLAAMIDMAIVRILCLFMPSLQLSKLLYGNCPGDRHTLAITNIPSRLYEIHQRLNKKQQAISLVHSFYLWPGPRFLTMPRYTK
jgi:hypothetical protein